MKIRVGFVSNSSSSSFILALTKMPETAEELRELLFGGGEYFAHPYEEVSYSTKTIAGYVFEALKACSPLKDSAAMAEVVANGWFDGRPDIPAHTIPYDQKQWDEHQKQVGEAAKKLADRFIGNNPNRKFYAVEFHDDTEIGSAVEHGDTFRAVRHMRVNRH